MSYSRITHQLRMQLSVDDSNGFEPVAGSPVTITSWIDAKTRTNSESVLDQTRRLAGDRPATSSVLQTREGGHPRSTEGDPIPFRQPITHRQRKFLLALARSAGIGAESLDRIVEHSYPGRSL
ncbi:MAG: hypothetical protein AB7V46_22160, partial [Thermomicrobiales bacterium]